MHQVSNENYSPMMYKMWFLFKENIQKFKKSICEMRNMLSIKYVANSNVILTCRNVRKYYRTLDMKISFALIYRMDWV